MRKLFAAALLVTLSLGMPWTGSAQKPGTLSKLMFEKLNSSKLLLEGIALADFNKINRSAETLIQLSRTAEWFVYKTPRYELHSNEFRRAAETILQKAKECPTDCDGLSAQQLLVKIQHIAALADATLTRSADSASDSFDSALDIAPDAGATILHSLTTTACA